jgi:hypothetical protein
MSRLSYRKGAAGGKNKMSWESGIRSVAKANGAMMRDEVIKLAAQDTAVETRHVPPTKQVSVPKKILRDCLHCGSFESNDCTGNVGLTGCEQWRKTSALL